MNGPRAGPVGTLALIACLLGGCTGQGPAGSAAASGSTPVWRLPSATAVFDYQIGGVVGFDFALAGECAVYHECGRYLTAYGDQVYEVEYTHNGIDAYGRACAENGERISILLRDRGVLPAGSAGYRDEHC
jgi:hypothetical protein